MSLNTLRRVLSHSGWSAAALHANELLSGVLSVQLQCHFCILSVSVAKSPVLPDAFIKTIAQPGLFIVENRPYAAALAQG